MSFLKQGEAIEISRVENIDSCVPMVNESLLKDFQKFASNLKRIAPKANDFLYFVATIIHAAEASAINDDGTPKLTTRGEPVQVGWDRRNGTWRWTTNDPTVKAYKNSNGDIFPESELIEAHRKWVGKPLCIDHKSSSVDHVRGFIVDTYYDRNLKRVVALCALDKLGYPQLARQVETGYSHCVSMGVGVSKAICTECAAVAQTEADFCDHMRRKSGYGEINTGLNPIELSIVVNGADPKAHIKHIIAAAQTLNSYVDSKAKELNKLADLSFNANLSVSTPKGQEDGGTTNISVQGNNLEEFKADLEKACKQLEEITSEMKKNTKDSNDLTYNQSSGTVASDEITLPNTDTGLAPPSVRYASSEINKDSLAELHEVTAAIEEKLNQMKQSLENLSKTKEDTMSGEKEMNKAAYFQGGGGVNEPTPGKPRYTKDPLNEEMRNEGDKQMNGQAPFPEVGPVDGMHPSPASVDPSNELERKKMLARAEAEERALRRTAIVDAAKQSLKNKEAYYQGGGGVNEPTPGKAKYPKDKLNEEDRDNEDKQMVGQKPFPGVGPVDGLHPSPASADVSDELKRKQMLSRASLRARFIKAANEDGTQNLGKSAWEVFLGDKLLLTASVNELSGNRSDFMYDSIATKDFGARLIEKVKVHGADKVRSLVKSAQEMPAPAPEAAPPAPESAPAPALPEMEDTGKEGDPKETIKDLTSKLRDLSSDLTEASNALDGERAEMGDIEEMSPEMATAASDNTTKSLQSSRKYLNTQITAAIKETVETLKGHVEELDMISGIYDKNIATASNKEFVNTIVEEAVNEAKTAVADGLKLMSVFVKYANGSKAVIKRAEMETELKALAEGEIMDTKDSKSGSSDDLMSLIQDTNSDLDEVKNMMADDNDHLTSELHDESKEMSTVSDANDLKAKPEEVKSMDLKPGTMVEVTASSDLETKEGRAALRAKLAADALGKYDNGEIQDMTKAKFSDMLDKANDLANGQTKLDTKPSDDLGLVETLPEQNKVMLEVAKMPPKVRKEAEAIQKLVSEGKLDPADLDELVAQGLDKDAVSYWKKYYGQVDGGGEFASELVKEHVKAQMEEELGKYRVKLARSYELAYDMVDRGLCHNDRSAVSAQVDEIMKFNDDGFESLKRVVARHAPGMRKEAGRMPQVGVLESVETPAPASNDLKSQLEAAFAKSTRRMF